MLAQLDVVLPPVRLRPLLGAGRLAAGPSRCVGDLQYSAAMVPPPRVKPKLRGVFHEFGFYASIAFGLPLMLTADPGRARVAAIVFSELPRRLLRASTVYHRPMWTPEGAIVAGAARPCGCLGLLIAGTYTPFGLLVMSKGWAVPVLAVV